MPSLFGWLDNIPWWRDLPYPAKGAILRALKAGLSGLTGVLVALAGAGVLFPVSWSPAVVIVITMILQGLDKFFREWNIEKEANESPQVTDNPPVEEDVPEPPAVFEPDPIDQPEDVGNDPDIVP